MATPMKPWEKTASGSPPGLLSVPGSKNTSTEFSKSPGQPAVPPRPASIPDASINPSRYCGPSYSTAPSYGMSGYGMYGSGYNYGGGGLGSGYSYGGGMGYRPYGMYGSSGGYGGSAGYGGQEESNVFRQAEERTRVAFQSVESVVGAVGSISMMLESTYVAVHSCFRALIGVAEHFSRLRNHLWSIISAISIIQRLKHLLRQVLQILRLRTYTPVEETWDSVEAIQSLQQNSPQRLWPAVMFFMVIVGVPWLLWKLVTSISTDQANPNVWSNGSNTESHSSALALYSFAADSRNELTINVGDELVVAPRQFQPNAPGWILVGRNKKSGLVPANYIEILPPGLISERFEATKATPSPALTLSDD